MILIYQRHRQTDGRHAISISRYALGHRAVRKYWIGLDCHGLRDNPNQSNIFLPRDALGRTADFIVELLKIRDNTLHISNVFSLADITDIIIFFFYVLHEVIHSISLLLISISIILF